jgi:hypothetical protein
LGPEWAGRAIGKRRVLDFFVVGDGVECGKKRHVLMTDLISRM